MLVKVPLYELTELSAPDLTVHRKPSTSTGEPAKPAHGPDGVGVAVEPVPVGPTGNGTLDEALAKGGGDWLTGGTPVPVGPTGNGTLDDELPYGAGDSLTGGPLPVPVGPTGNGTLDEELTCGAGNSLTDGLLPVPVGPTGNGTLDEELPNGAGDWLIGGLIPVPVTIGGTIGTSLLVVFGNGTTDSVMFGDGLPVPVTIGGMNTISLEVVFGYGTIDSVMFCEEMPVPVTKRMLLDLVVTGGKTPVPVGPAKAVLFVDELAAYEVTKCTRMYRVAGLGPGLYWVVEASVVDASVADAESEAPIVLPGRYMVVDAELP